ncbi:hypothetical protein ACFY64_31875 [Streptomyces collinus]|uniref:hypothetical protein n=1 Tax=Streptomyces collinus TaxID=42684 RepID=UPI0036805BF9
MSMLSATVTAKAVSEGFVFIGHDLDGWTVALIAAVIAAVIYELAMALTKMITLRIPFLILQIARLVTPTGARPVLYERWKADLWYILRGEGPWIVRSLKGVWFSAQLAVYGARSTASVVTVDSIKRRPLPLSRLIAVTAGFFSLGRSATVAFDLEGSPAMIVLFISLTLGVLLGVIAMGLAYMKHDPKQD